MFFADLEKFVHMYFFFFYIFFQLHSFEVSDYLSKPLTLLHESLCIHTSGHFLFQ